MAEPGGHTSCYWYAQRIACACCARSVWFAIAKFCLNTQHTVEQEDILWNWIRSAQDWIYDNTFLLTELLTFWNLLDNNTVCVSWSRDIWNHFIHFQDSTSLTDPRGWASPSLVWPHPVSYPVSKLLAATSPGLSFLWPWTFWSKATDRQRVDGFLRRSIRSGYCSPDTPIFAEQCATVDEQLFNNICHNQNHVLYSLLPSPSTASQNYHLRPRAHSQQLPQHTGHLTDSNFIKYKLDPY